MIAIEVVAVRSLEEELVLLSDSREKVLGQPHPTEADSDSPAGLLPSIGNVQCLQWYGDLSAIADQEALRFNLSEPGSNCWVVEIALAPPAQPPLAEDLAAALRERLGQPISTAMANPEASTEKVWHLREVVPKQVSRVFAWPARPTNGEAALRERTILRANPGMDAIHPWMEARGGRYKS
jgi:hypothetical protein